MWVLGSMKVLQSMGLGVCGVNGYSGKECYKSGDVVGIWSIRVCGDVGSKCVRDPRV